MYYQSCLKSRQGTKNASQLHTHMALYYINPYHCYVPFLLGVGVLAVICHCGMSRKEGLLLKRHLESKQQPAEQDLFISLLVR